MSTKNLREPGHSGQPDEQMTIASSYFLNVSIILGLCFGLLATRSFDVFDRQGAADTQFLLAVAISFLVLLVTWLEYYYFVLTVKRTNHFHDALSPLLLGGLQAIAIAFIGHKHGEAVSQGWWYAEAFYAALGIALLINTRNHLFMIEDKRERTVVRWMLDSSIVFCGGFIFLLFVPRYFIAGPGHGLSLVLAAIWVGVMIGKNLYLLEQVKPSPRRPAHQRRESALATLTDLMQATKTCVRAQRWLSRREPNAG